MRCETVTIDGETFKPEDHSFTKDGTQFGPPSFSERNLPEKLARGRASLDERQKHGTLSKKKWAEITACQVGAINYAHPFCEGNGRTMRRFIELSAEQYGFRARIIGGAKWVQATKDAMYIQLTNGLQEFIEQNTTEGE